MLALSALYEGFARGDAYLHTAQLPVQKSLAAKSCICPTSKLIQNKQLQLLHFGHLRKTGGRGSYCLVHAGPPIKDLRPEPPERVTTLTSTGFAGLSFPARNSARSPAVCRSDRNTRSGGSTLPGRPLRFPCGNSSSSRKFPVAGRIP